MEAFARVQRIEGERAWLKVIDAGGGCGRCDEPGGCRSMQLSQAFGIPRDEFMLSRRQGVAVGDRVRIRIADGAPLRAALASYGLAVTLLLAGAAAGSGFGGTGNADVPTAIGGGAGLLLAFLVNRRLACSRNWRNGLRIELVVDRECGRAAPPGRP